MHLLHSLWVLQTNEISQFLGPPPQWFLQWVEILTAVAAVVISALLMKLYRRQQRELAANHTSILDVANVEWNRDEATIYLSNYGNGVVWNLSLVTLMHIDSGAHRDYALKHTPLQNQETQGKLSTVIQNDREAVPFKAESKVRIPKPPGIARGWISTSFSSFIRILKEEGASEVEYLHAIQGRELSGKRIVIPLPELTRQIDVKYFERDHSLENLPRVLNLGEITTFRPYLNISYGRKLENKIYRGSVRLIDWIIPKISVLPRRLDLSGTKRVRRTLLKRAIKHRIKKFWVGFKAKISTLRNIRRTTESEEGILVVDEKDEED